MKRYKFQSEVPVDFHGQCYITAFFPDTPATVWYEHGIEHRLDGPAVMCDNGSWFWRFNDKGHRIDGPCAYWSKDCGYPDRAGKYYYYLSEKQLSEEEYWSHPLVVKNKLKIILSL